MSLLLDALKRAEKAKDDARRREQSADPPSTDDAFSQVRTRNELPDIASPLELHSEDVPGRGAAARSDNPVPDAFSTAPARAAIADTGAAREPLADATPKRRQPTSSEGSGSDALSAQRAAARQVFEAKFREPNPKLPFYITMAFLGAFAIGTIVYFWYQLRPPPPLVNTNAKPPPDEKKVEARAVEPPPTTLSNQKNDVGLPTAQANAGLPPAPVSEKTPAPTPAGLAKAPGGGAASTKADSRSATQNDQPRAAPREPSRTVRRPTSPQESRPVADPSALSINRGAASIHPKVEAGWNAYNRGDLSTARSNYQEVLKDEPTSRDALLGMAAIELRANRPEQAEAYYRSVLQINPRDPYAQTGLLALRGQGLDSSQTESRVKSLLATDPEAQVLHFTLGNQYAQQSRWAEAQQAYFKAYSGDPENPDFAFNLAVSLDQLRQSKLALEYYRRAILLAQQRSSSFDQALARNRAQELTR